jgi:hypothetical protein
MQISSEKVVPGASHTHCQWWWSWDPIFVPHLFLLANIHVDRKIYNILTGYMQRPSVESALLLVKNNRHFFILE